ncbi:hypothetical protein J0J30_23850, partial [Vibrio vulnificus]|nr:hypothetical protein [Vibrio vulnificus]
LHPATDLKVLKPVIKKLFFHFISARSSNSGYEKYQRNIGIELEEAQTIDTIDTNEENANPDESRN